MGLPPARTGAIHILKGTILFMSILPIMRTPMTEKDKTIISQRKDRDTSRNLKYLDSNILYSVKRHLETAKNDCYQ